MSNYSNNLITFDGKIKCLYCSFENDNKNRTCKKCGNFLHLIGDQGNVIDVSPDFANNVEELINFFPEYNKMLKYVPKNNSRINTLNELFNQNNYNEIFNDISSYFKIYSNTELISFEKIANKKYQSLAETIAFYAVVLSKTLIEKRTSNNPKYCSKKCYEIVAFILGFDYWLDVANTVLDKNDFDNYNISLTKTEIEYLNARLNNNIVKEADIADSKKIEIKKKRPSIITIALCSVLLLCMLIGAYFTFFKINIEKCKDSVVMLKIYDKYGNNVSTGSGFCAIDESYIITNYHVIEGAYSIEVITDDNSLYNVTSVKIFKPNFDLAIIEFNGKLKKLPLGNPLFSRTGDEIVAIGSPLGELNTVSKGTISNMDSDELIRITAPISHGSSGGVLFNKFGKVIGITNAGYEEGQNLNYAISVDLLKSLKENLDDGNYLTLTPDSYRNVVGVRDSITNDMFEKNIIANDSYYSCNDLVSLYRSTSEFAKFDETLSTWTGKIPNVYNSFDSKIKHSVVEHFAELKSYDNTSNISEAINNVANWSIYDWILNLKIMDRWELAIFIEDYGNLGTRNGKGVVASYSSSAGSLIILEHLFGYLNISNLSQEYKHIVIEYIYSLKYMKPYEKGKVLEKLGFWVIYNQDGSINTRY